MIQERLKTAQSRQKSYKDVRRRSLEFQVDDWVYFNMSPMKGFMRFCKKVKLSPGILDHIESPKEWAMWLMSWSYPKS